MTGNCITHTGSPVNLITEYIVPIPFNVPAPGQTKPASVQTAPASVQIMPESMMAAQESSEINARYSTFLYNAYSSFYEEIGYKGCAATLPPSQIYPVYIGREAATSETATPVITSIDSSSTTDLTSPLKSSGSVQRAETTRTIIISVVISTTALIIILLCFIVIRIYRKKRSQTAPIKYSRTISDMQPYVDQKVELEDEQRRRHELDAGRRIYEMEGEDRIFEMPGNRDTGTRSSRSNRIQELRGAEHSIELEVPSNI